MSGEEGQGRQAEASRHRQAGSVYELQRVTTPTALPALGSTRSRSGARASPTLPRRLSIGRVPLCLFVVLVALARLVSRSASVPLEPHATSRRAAPRHIVPYRATPRRSSRCSLPQARARSSLFPRSIRLALPFEPRRCYIPLPFSPSLLFLAPASLLPPFRPFSQDVCFTLRSSHSLQSP